MNANAPHLLLELSATEPLAEAAPSVAAVSGIDLLALQAALERLGRGCARRIEFDVEGRSVRLRGNVRSYFQKQLAQHQVMQIAGVEQVINHLSVE
jgi:hypothetical protein